MPCHIFLFILSLGSHLVFCVCSKYDDITEEPMWLPLPWSNNESWKLGGCHGVTMGQGVIAVIVTSYNSLSLSLSLSCLIWNVHIPGCKKAAFWALCKDLSWCWHSKTTLQHWEVKLILHIYIFKVWYKSKKTFGMYRGSHDQEDRVQGPGTGDKLPTWAIITVSFGHLHCQYDVIMVH